jgi:hypothetical protein
LAKQKANAKLVGGIALVIALLLTAAGFWMTRPSYGPAGAAEVELIAAPGVSIDALPSHHSLSTMAFEDFDVSPNGTVLVLNMGRIFDMASGDELVQQIHSLAFFGDGLLLVDFAGQFGYYDDGTFKRVGQMRMPQTRLNSTTDKRRAVAFVKAPSSNESSPALAVIDAGGPLKPLTRSDSAITAAASDGFQTVFATYNRLWRIFEGGVPSRIVELPGPEPIVGLAALGGRTYYSTSRGIWALDSDMALPIVLGLGGQLRTTREALYVLSTRNGRIYRVGLAAQPPA